MLKTASSQQALSSTTSHIPSCWPVSPELTPAALRDELMQAHHDVRQHYRQVWGNLDYYEMWLYTEVNVLIGTPAGALDNPHLRSGWAAEVLISVIDQAAAQQLTA